MKIPPLQKKKSIKRKILSRADGPEHSDRAQGDFNVDFITVNIGKTLLQ